MSTHDMHDTQGAQAAQVTDPVCSMHCRDCPTLATRGVGRTRYALADTC